MSTAAMRFVLARRALRQNLPHYRCCPKDADPQVWASAMLSQAQLRALEPEHSIPISVARQWALDACRLAAAGEVPVAAVMQTGMQLDAIQALRGWYLRRAAGGVLGPFDTAEQAAHAMRAARGHGVEVELEDRTLPEAALTVL